MRVGETPAEHFKKCGPFCSHVTWCEHCINVFGFCGRPGCDGEPKWKQAEPGDTNACVELSNN